MARILARVARAPPLRFEPLKPSIGYLNPGETRSAEFFCWSPTRDNPDVSFQPREPDPLFQVESHALSADECKRLEENMHEEQNNVNKQNPPKDPKSTPLNSS